MIGFSLRLLRLGGRSAVTAAGLTAAGVLVATLLLTIGAGALHGLDARADRTGWRTPAEAERVEPTIGTEAEHVEPTAGTEAGPAVGTAGEAPVARLRVRVDHAAGLPIAQVDLAALDPTGAPPPGLPHLPGPGELWVSPALADLLRALPADALAARYPGPVSGLIGDAGLQRPDELVAVVGRTPADPVFTAPGASAVVSVAGFDRPTVPDELEVYRALTIVAVTLVVFPVAGLLGASARLTALRRSERLATLRLLGASTRQITTVAATEVTVVATVAAALGVTVEWALSPLIARIPLAGGGWFAADVRPGPLLCLAIVAAVGLLAAGSAAAGLRKVVIGPLGVARRQQARGVRLLRLAGAAAGIVVFLVAQAVLQVLPVDSSGLVGMILALGVLALFGVVSLVGPLVVRAAGKWLVARGSGPAALIAGRRLLDDPRGAFRPLAGVTLAIFVAGFLAPLTALVTSASFRADTQLWLRPEASAVAGAELAQRARGELARAGIAARVGDPVPPRGGSADRYGAPVPVAPADPADTDRVRTLLAPLTPGALVYSDAESDATGAVLVGDIRRGVFMVLVATFALAATATGTAAAARVLDHRHTLRLLRTAGAPLTLLNRARWTETVRPLLVNGGIALGLGLFCASPFAAASMALQPAGLAVLGAVLFAGLAAVVAAVAASRPMLRSLTDPERHR